MATSKITIYHPVARLGLEWKLLPERLFQLDNIASYLAPFESLSSQSTTIDYNYIKFELEMTLKLVLPQEYVNPRRAAKPVYLKIINTNEKPMYYYVKNYTWRSSNCVELEIFCDVLNSLLGTYAFGNKTMVMREHRDRFKKIEYQLNHLRDIDEFIENTYYRLDGNLENSPALSFYSGKVFLHTIYDPEENELPANPLTHEVTAMSFDREGGDPVGINFTVTGEGIITLDIDDLRSGDYYLYIGENEVGNGIYFEDIERFYGLDKYIEIEEVSNFIYQIDRVAENINPILFARKNNYPIIKNKTDRAKLFSKWYLMFKTETVDENSPVNSYLITEKGGTDSVTSRVLKSIYDIDRTDPTIVKIISLPYPASTFIPSSAEFNANFSYISDEQDAMYGTYKDSTLTTRTANYTCIIAQPSDYVSIFKEMAQNNATVLEDISYDTLRTLKDTKLFASEFFIPKFIYDSFTLPVMCENLDIETMAEDLDRGWFSDNILFHVTTTINSRFAFEFEGYREKYRENDYPHFLVIARNNELPLFSTAYLNYIRNGYNYDVKNKNVSTAMTWLGFGASVIGTGASIAAAVASGGIAIPIAVGMATSTAMSLTSAIATTSQNERNLDQKINQLKNQSASVVGSDDYDIFKVYNGNVLLYNQYKPTVEMENLIDNLFFYTGYATNRMGQPNTNNRLHFNFVQCEPELLSIAGMYRPGKEFEDELIRIMRTGYTILHKVNDKYDFDQKYENIETSIYNHFNGGN